MNGIITKWIEFKAFGFIQPSESGSTETIFFHKNGVVSSCQHLIQEGKAVDYQIGQDRIGRPCAENVEIEDN